MSLKHCFVLNEINEFYCEQFIPWKTKSKKMPISLNILLIEDDMIEIMKFNRV
jgi:hypothetical protein